MHPRNPYRAPPDFDSLAQSYPELKRCLVISTKNAGGQFVTINFRDEVALRKLTEAIMFRDFGVKLKIPDDRLCPPIPNRMNYVLWIQDVVQHTLGINAQKQGEIIRGVDIGTGATAIYPVLLSSLEKTWEMVGTEIDDASYLCASSNIETNHLQSRIKIVKAEKLNPILQPLNGVIEDSMYHFTMCNPPFYSSSKEIESLAKGKHLPPNAVCTGSTTEMIYPGGEVAFVGKMVDESTTYRRQCRWYTSMLGKLSSVEKIVQRLRSHNIANYAITEFIQGRTRRWAVAWSFFEDRLPDSISRMNVSSSHPLSTYMPPRNTLSQPLQSSTAVDLRNIETALENALKLVQRITLTVTSDDQPPNAQVYILEAAQNTWSRSARRQQRHGGSLDFSNPPSSAITMVCSVKVSQGSPISEVPLQNKSYQADEWSEVLDGLDEDDDMDIDDSSTVEEKKRPDTQHTQKPLSLVFQWLSGEDRAMFESFASHVGRKVGVVVSSTNSSN
ncbi:hypothetical protein CPB83DRAFT_897251 [Crepidotus variabilis]|uniref:U6 small nuclear RNA (adenine-(43)-N(6))-methyltransferase n=1 Tax=Crepidotus variabilis TaxID=179855 RepID=A0A9P6JLA2_9AGAR|nr:hypothetical protein CPB83DRAFT_897251 [Crepidotus variabilis]